ncbi:DUF6778 family protein [Hasllibacter sp. MH4015]|uniref:DUF6778 family protein n=1 Tax=Hasllibacter sp. MH4015 TaxID=2854029 RepID=UPI001CD4DB96|nr:DUF6778 family protein [Hasllibacter sp. MH4015]
MRTSRFIPALVLGAALAVSGCVGTSDVSRDLSIDDIPVIENVAFMDWDVVAFEVDVPRTLTVSEANTIKPRADIVWREDPLGDRHEQVDILMTEALAPAFEAVQGGTPVIVTLTVTRFHAQTQRVRYSRLPSEHEVEFELLITHAETGQILSGPRAIDVTFDAYNNEEALAADARGETQRVRITQRLRDWVQAEFIGPVVPAANPELLALAR